MPTVMRMRNDSAAYNKRLAGRHKDNKPACVEPGAEFLCAGMCDGS